MSFLRALMPRSLLRTNAFKALTERVRSLVMDSQAVTGIRRPWRVSSFRRGRRSFSTGKGSAAVASRWEVKASVLPTPRFFLASMRGATATGNPWVATMPARIAPSDAAPSMTQRVSASALVRRDTQVMAQLMPASLAGNDYVSSNAPLAASRNM